MENVNEKMRFSITLNDEDKSVPIITNECFLYGSIGGCDEYCPVYQRNQCELQKENERIFNRRLYE